MKNKTIHWMGVFLIGLLFFCASAQHTQAKPNINKATVTLPKSRYVYTGKAICPKATVKFQKKTLKRNKDYKLTYRNNKKIGTAYISVKGIGKYSGKATKKFYIRHSDRFNSIIDFGKPEKIKQYFKLTTVDENMKVRVNRKAQTISQTATVDDVKYTLKIELWKYAGKTTAKQLLTCTELFWDCYPQMYQRFAVKKTPVTVRLAVENEGYEIACTSGNQVHLHDKWLKNNKKDFDCLTHEFAHVIQTEWDDYYVPTYEEDTYMIERFADYCRYIYAHKNGYYNDVVWELQNRENENHYSTSNRFWVWLDYKYSTKKIDIMKRIAKAIKSEKGAYQRENWENTGSAWKQVFKGTGAEGKSLKSLWKKFCKDDFSMCNPCVPEYGETSEMIERYNVREIVKGRR
ncbi:MAG: hypothetical protein K6G65_02005 [Lachnospiraceae bacterium]|nr:hypothetical protein [Lachnospiraceae bacterium]